MRVVRRRASFSRFVVNLRALLVARNVPEPKGPERSPLWIDGPLVIIIPDHHPQHALALALALALTLALARTRSLRASPSHLTV